MPGRVKKRIVRPRPGVTPPRRNQIKARAPAPQVPPPTAPVTQGAPIPPAPPAAPTTSSPVLSGNTADPRSQIVDKHALTWIVILLLIIVVGLGIVSWLLCRCRRRRRNKDGSKNLNAAGHSHHPSLEVTDGRNNHFAWNRNAPQQIAMVDRSWMKESEGLTPLAKAAIKPAGYRGDAMGSSVVEVGEDDGVSPLTTRFDRKDRYEGVKGRYDSSGGWGEWWKRVSQIGRAY